METLKNLKIRFFLLITLLGFIIMFILPMDNLFFVKYLREKTWITIQSDITYYLIPFLIIIFYQMKNGKSISVFFKSTKFKISDIILADLGTLLLGTGLTCIIAFSIFNFIDMTEPLISYKSQGQETLYSLCEAVIIGPFFEEIIFRGYLLERMSKKWGKLNAVFISSLIFGIMHSVGFISTFLIGILYAIIRYKYNSLFPIIIAHMANNIFVRLLKAIIYSNSFGLDDSNLQYIYKNNLQIWIVLVMMISVGGFLYWTFLRKNNDILKKIKSD